MSDALVPSSTSSQLTMTAHGLFPFDPFVCGQGTDKQNASSYDEIMNFYAQAIVFNMFYLFYVPICFNSFIYYRLSLKTVFENDYKPHFKI